MLLIYPIGHETRGGSVIVSVIAEEDIRLPDEVVGMVRYINTNNEPTDTSFSLVFVRHVVSPSQHGVAGVYQGVLHDCSTFHMFYVS